MTLAATTSRMGEGRALLVLRTYRAARGRHRHEEYVRTTPATPAARETTR